MKSTFLLSLAVTSLAAVSPARTDKMPFHITGMYLEGCSCAAPCTCEMSGPEKGCEGVGAFSLTGGEYMGAKMAGAKFAYALGAGKWVAIYVQAASAEQRPALVALAKAGLAAFGPVVEVRDAAIVITGDSGAYTMSVDAGKVMTIKTQPMTGGDGKSPLMYSNIFDALHPSVMGGKTVSCSFHDGKRRFELADSNAFFNSALDSSGNL